jgi:hypothetical protein
MEIITITILFIFFSTAITTILKAIKKDKCLKDFRGYYTTLIEIDDETHDGKFRLEATGFELTYKTAIVNDKKEKESSYIFYKDEYNDMKYLLRFHNKLTAKGKRKRKKELRKSYHPNVIRKSLRRFLNFIQTIKNALVEVVNLLLSQVKKMGPKMLTEQNAQISKIKKDMMGTIEPPNFDPLLEHHIGNIVILEIAGPENTFISHRGVLKEYTSNFFEIMDVDYAVEDKILKTDLIVPRKKSIIKHYAE